MNKKLLCSMFLVVLVCGFVLVGAARFGTVKAATSVSGIISSDTTWTKADSPINITWSTKIAKGVTVTIEPGVVVHFNAYDLWVDGALRAIGTSAEPITLNGDYRPRLPAFGSSDSNGRLAFNNECSGWNEQTGTGCIIENTNIISLSISVDRVAVKMNNNFFSGSFAWGGITVYGDDSVISNNRITATGSTCPLILNGSSLVTDNTLIGQYIRVVGGSPSILGNVLYSERAEMRVSDDDTVGNVTINGNVIANCFGFNAQGGNVTFENNLVLECSGGCSFGSEVNVIIQHNTIAFNGHGIKMEWPPASAKIIYNNIENNTLSNFSWGGSSYFNATYNWWGTTNEDAIRQKLVFTYQTYDPLCNVTFIPYLTEPNPQAPLISSFVAPSLSPSPSPTATPTPTSSPTPMPEQTPTPTPSQEPTQNMQFEAVLGAAIVVAVLGAGLGLLFYLIKRK